MLDKLFHFIYSISLKIIYFFIYFISNFNDRLFKLQKHQNNWKFQFNSVDLDSCIWIHVASVGEFKMSIPLILSIKNTNPDLKIVVSFFSVSVFNFLDEVEKYADFYFLFPKDYAQNIKFIIQQIKPKSLILIQNERWLNLISVCYNCKIKIFLVEAKSKHNINYFSSIYYFYVDKFINKIFYETDGSLKLQNVFELNNNLYKFNSIENYTKHSFVIILGSCYLNEVIFVANFYKKYPKQVKIIFAPHVLTENTIASYQKYFEEKIGAFTRNEFNSNLLLLDTYGMLKDVYSYADVAFVGGGFQNKLHNVFEPLAYKVPVVIGNLFKNDFWIDQFISNKNIKVISTNNEFENYLLYIKNSKANFSFNNSQFQNLIDLNSNLSYKIWKEIYEKIID